MNNFGVLVPWSFLIWLTTESCFDNIERSPADVPGSTYQSVDNDSSISPAAVKCPTHLWILIYNRWYQQRCLDEFQFWIYCCGRDQNLPCIEMPLRQASKYSPIPFSCHCASATFRRNNRLFSLLYIASARLDHRTLCLHLNHYQLCVYVCGEIQLQLAHLVKAAGFLSSKSVLCLSSSSS